MAFERLKQPDVAFQCKRWTNRSSSRSDIDPFRGANQGHFKQGCFFTTSTFLDSAKDASFRKGAVPILLLDGPAIVQLMIDKQFGIIHEALPVFSLALDEALS